ncbi:MAG: flavodoxin [Desulfovibrionaceae bacterium CG1_02_65_16]|nr:MAG: flavodoxin [Desulfovibrionaceae bacterium CG1_02_65_16]
MNIIAINGSPRKKWNTATLLTQALEGAREAGAQTELVNLYDLDYKGCISCFSCKKIGGKSYGRCAMKDDLTPVLERIAEADALILGTPVYFHTETGEARSFMERLLFPYVTYTPGYKAIFPRPLPTALIYTMNVAEADAPHAAIEYAAGVFTRVFGSCETLLSTDTLQFSDYSKYLSTCWDGEAKAKRRAEIFPQDCVKARELGARLVQAGAKGK